MKKVVYSVFAVLCLCGCKKPEQKGSIIVVAYDANNAPLQNVTVSIEEGNNDNQIIMEKKDGASYQTNRTDTYGNAYFYSLSQGNHTLIAEKSGYNTLYRSVSVEAGKSKRMEITLERKPSAMTISPSELNFGTEYAQRTFSITNSNGDEPFDWEIACDAEWFVKAEPSRGTLSKNNTTQVVVTINQLPERSSAEQIAISQLIVTSTDNGRIECPMTAKGIYMPVPVSYGFEYIINIAYIIQITHTGDPAYIECGCVLINQNSGTELDFKYNDPVPNAGKKRIGWFTCNPASLWCFRAYVKYPSGITKYGETICPTGCN